jgi:hypothetical protein
MCFSFRNAWNGVAATAVLGAAISVPAAAATITFDRDPTGFKGLPFQSVDSALVTFDILFAIPSYHASNLFIVDTPETRNSNALQLSGYVPDELIMGFAVTATSLSFDFGGDTPSDTPPPPIAVLTLFSGTSQVGLVQMPSTATIPSISRSSSRVSLSTGQFSACRAAVPRL